MLKGRFCKLWWRHAYVYKYRNMRPIPTRARETRRPYTFKLGMGTATAVVQLSPTWWLAWASRTSNCEYKRAGHHTWYANKVRELIAVKVLHTSLLNTTVVAFKVLPFGSYAPMLAPSPPIKTILELVLWNGLQICRCITPDVINVIKMPSFQYFLYLREQEKVTGC